MGRGYSYVCACGSVTNIRMGWRDDERASTVKDFFEGYQYARHLYICPACRRWENGPTYRRHFRYGTWLMMRKRPSEKRCLLKEQRLYVPKCPQCNKVMLVADDLQDRLNPICKRCGQVKEMRSRFHWSSYEDARHVEQGTFHPDQAAGAGCAVLVER